MEPNTCSLRLGPSRNYTNSSSVWWLCNHCQFVNSRNSATTSIEMYLLHIKAAPWYNTLLTHQDWALNSIHSSRHQNCRDGMPSLSRPAQREWEAFTNQHHHSDFNSLISFVVFQSIVMFPQKCCKLRFLPGKKDKILNSGSAWNLHMDLDVKKKGQLSRLVKCHCWGGGKTQCSATLLMEHDKPSIGNVSKGSASFKLISRHNNPVIICKWADCKNPAPFFWLDYYIKWSIYLSPSIDIDIHYYTRSWPGLVLL